MNEHQCYHKTPMWDYETKDSWKNRTFMDYNDVIHILKEKKLIE